MSGVAAATCALPAAEKAPAPSATYKIEMGGWSHGAVTRGSVIIIPGFIKKVVQQMDSTKAGKTPRWNTFNRP